MTSEAQKACVSSVFLLSFFLKLKFIDKYNTICNINPFAPGDFAEKRILKLVEWFSGHCRSIKS